MASPDAVIDELEQRVARATQTLDALIAHADQLRLERDELRAALLDARRSRRRAEGLEAEILRLRQQNEQLRQVREEALQRARSIVRKLGILNEDLGLRTNRSATERVSEAQA